MCCLEILDSNLFCSGGGDNNIHLWKNMEFMSTLSNGHTNWVLALLKIDDEYLISGA